MYVGIVLSIDKMIRKQFVEFACCGDDEEEVKSKLLHYAQEVIYKENAENNEWVPSTFEEAVENAVGDFDLQRITVSKL